MMRLEVEQLSNVSVVRAREDIDAANARRVRDELAACMGGPAEHLVLDLSATRYLDSAGIDMLFRLNERLRERRARLQLVIPPTSQLARLAEIVSLPSAMPIHETVEQALAACAQQAGE